MSSKTVNTFTSTPILWKIIIFTDSVKETECASDRVFIRDSLYKGIGF